MFSRLGNWCHDHRRLVLGLWIAAFIIGGMLQAAGNSFRDEFNLPDSESRTGFDILDEHFGGEGTGINGTIVFQAPQGVDDPEVEQQMQELFDKTAQIPDVKRVISPYAEEGSRQIGSEGAQAGQIAYAEVEMPDDIDIARAGEIRDAILDEAPRIEGLRIEMGGWVFAEFEQPSSEALGIAFAIFILILAFGSVLAMGLPVGVALFGIGIGTSIVIGLSQLFTVPETAQFIGLMIGLGVGIDYALLIVTRYREQLHAGHTVRESIAIAMDTAGRSVLFAGTTVVISLIGLLIVRVVFVNGLALGAALVVAITMAASLTLLPALLGFAGERIEVTRWRGLIAAGFAAIGLLGAGLGVGWLAGLGFGLALITIIAGFFVPALKREVKRRPPKPRRQTTAYRWSRVIQHRPWTSALAGAVILLFLAIPVLGLRLGNSDESNYPDDTSTKQAYDLLVAGFGPGFNGPLLLVAELPEGTDVDSLDAVTETVAADPDVALASPPRLNEDGTAVVWQVIPNSGPQEKETTQLVERLRDDVLAPVEDEIGTQVAVTGNVAVGIDFSDYLGLADAVLLRRGAGPVVPAADGGVPVAAGPGQGRDHEHAVDRSRLRHRRRPVPVGLAQRHHGGGAGAHRAVDPDDAVRHRLRVVHGLRGVPALPHPRGVDPHRRQPHRGRRRPGLDRQGHHRGGRHHGVRLRQLHPRERPGAQADGHRPGGRDPARRHRRPHAARARHDGAARRPQLVAAPLARPHPARPRRRGPRRTAPGGRGRGALAGRARARANRRGGRLTPSLPPGPGAAGRVLAVLATPQDFWGPRGPWHLRARISRN